MRLSRIEEQHPPATLKRNKNTHNFCQKKKSLFFTLFFLWGKKRAEKSSQQKSRRTHHHRAQKRILKVMMSNDDDGVHFALTTRFFFRCSRADHFDPRRFVRANIENDDDDDDADVSLATRFSLRSFYPNDDFGDERRRRRGRGLPRKNASAETTTTKKKKKPTAPYFWSAQSLSVARETRTIRKRPT